MSVEEPQWKKSNRIESGSYPKSSFVGVLEAIYPSYNENLKAYVLQLDFTDGKTYNIPVTINSDKAKTEDGVFGVHEDGSYDSFLAIGQFLDSIERLDAVTGLPDDNSKNRVQTFWAWMDNNPTGFKTEPDIVGKKLHNIATKRVVGDEQQTSKYPDWTIGQVEGLDAKPAKPPAQPAKKPGKLPPKTQTKEPAAQTEGLSDLVLEALSTPTTIKGLFEGFSKKYKVGELREIIGTLESDGFIEKGEGDRYTKL